jgi:hypothetical protein
MAVTHGERDGTRTHDPLIKSQMLYQLSYALADWIFLKSACVLGRAFFSIANMRRRKHALAERRRSERQLPPSGRRAAGQPRFDAQREICALFSARPRRSASIAAAPHLS